MQLRKNFLSLKGCITLCASLLFCLHISTGHAETTWYWIGESDANPSAWNDDENWYLYPGFSGSDPDSDYQGMPEAGDTVTLGNYQNSDREKVVHLSDYITPEFDYVNIDRTQSLIVEEGGILNASVLQVGLSSRSYLFQTDGEINIVDMWLGNGPDGIGEFEKDGGNLNISRDMVVGNYGNGYFYQGGGNTTIDGTLIASFSSSIGDPSASSIVLYGDSTLSVHDILLGYSGSSSMAQLENSVATVLGNLYIGGQNGYANGSYWLEDNSVLWVGGTTTVGFVEGTGSFSKLSDTSTFETGTLVVGAGASATGTFFLGDNEYEMTGGEVFVNGETLVGQAGKGTFEHDNGTLTVGTDLILGNEAGGAGTYILETGAVNVGDWLIIGKEGSGEFTQKDGIVAMGTSGLEVGQYAGSDGSYTLKDGSLEIGSGELRVGNAGTGTFIQNGGVITVGKDMTIGIEQSGKGSYLMTDGTLNVFSGSLLVGDAGAGSFTQSGGTNTVSKGISIGNQETGDGLYTMYAGTLEALSAVDGLDFSLIVGNNGTGEFDQDGGNVVLAQSLLIGNKGTGIYLQNGGLNSVGWDMILGDEAGSSGSYTLGAGTGVLGVNSGELLVGNAGTGKFIQNGGTVTIGYDVKLGYSGDGNGSYTLTNGVLDVFSRSLFIGYYGKGTFLQSGGSVTVAQDVVVGKEVASTDSSYTLSGGTLTLGTDGWLKIGEAGSGTFTQTGGDVKLSSGSTLVLGQTSTGVGTYTLSGGTLGDSASSGFDLIAGDAGEGHFTQDGVDLNLNELVVGSQTDSVGTYTLDGNASLTVQNEFMIGKSGTGTFTQEDGDVLFYGTFLLGVNTGSSGSYAFNGGTLTSDEGAFDLTIGDAGEGIFTQSGTTTLGLTSLMLGAQETGTGTYTMNGGTLGISSDTVTVGASGTGTVTQTGGEITLASGSTLVLGQASTGVGTYTLSGGTLGDSSFSVFNLVVGGAGEGHFTQDGVDLNLSELVVGAQTDSVGTYTLDGNALLTVQNEFTIGKSGTGTFTQEDGNILFYGTFLIGVNTGSSGSYAFNGGTLTSDEGAFDLTIGDAGEGIFTQGATNLSLASLVIGAQETGTGMYEIKAGGTLGISSDTITVGASGIGTITQTGGEITLAAGSTLVLGQETTGVGTYVLSDGILKDTAFAGFNLIAGDAGEGHFTQDGVDLNLSALVIGSQTDSVGTYTLDGNASLTVQNEFTIGKSGTGTFTQEDGDVLFYGTFLLGVNAGSSGNYAFNGGTLTSDEGAFDLTIGDAGEGIFTQSGTTTLGLTGLMLGAQETGTGTYTMNGGTLGISSDTVTVGASGTGTVTQTGGEITLAAGSTLVLGQESTGVGTYTLSGGTLGDSSFSVFNLVVGGAGEGHFAQDGVDLNLNSLVLGSEADSTGTYTLKENSILDVLGEFTIGKSGTGSFTQEGGEMIVWNDLTLGLNQNSLGSYTFSNGTLHGGGSAAFNLTVGDAGSGDFTQKNTDLSLFTLTLGSQSTGIGTYTIGEDDTALNIMSDTVVIGENGTGTFTQTGGDVALTAGSTLILGETETGTGTYTLSGGTLADTENEGFNLIIGDAGKGLFKQEASELLLSNLVLGSKQTGSGTYTITDGTLDIADTLLVGDEGSGDFNLAGGVVTVNTAEINSRFNYSGGDLIITDTFTNNNIFSINAQDQTNLNVNGNVVNNGTVKVVNTTVSYTGTFVNNGEYYSDPSTNNFTDLIINVGGYLIGGLGDKFYISGDFENYSTQVALWDTADAYLGFVTGDDTEHDYFLGDTAADYTWDTLYLEASNSLTFYDETGSFFDGDLFFDTIILGDSIDIASLFGDSMTLYYNILYDSLGNLCDAKNYTLASGITLAYKGSDDGDDDDDTHPVPEPSTMILFGSGLTGLAFKRKKYMGKSNANVIAKDNNN